MCINAQTAGKIIIKLFIMLSAWKQKRAERKDFPSEFKEGI